MTDRYTSNYKSAYVDVPSDLFEKGEFTGKKRILFGKILADVAIQANEKIYVGKLPRNSIVTNACIRIDKSLGATGIFSLGHGASADGTTHTADADAFIAAADAGGQAVLERPTLAAVGIYKRFTEEVEIYATCTEVMDGTVLTGTIYLELEYVND